MTTTTFGWVSTQVLLDAATISPKQYAPMGGGSSGAQGMPFPRPRLPGAFARDPNEVIPALRVTLRSRHDPARVTNVTSGKGFTWQDTLNEAGAASFVVPNDDVALFAELHSSTFVLFEAYGFAAFTMLARELNRTVIAQGEESAQLTTVSGPGTLAVLEEALVFPSRGVGAWPIEEDRVFSWQSPDYVDWWWGQSDGIVTAAEPDTYWSRANLKDWPDPDAMWMWAPGYGQAWAPAGACYFRATVDVPDGATELVLYSAFDDYGDVYVDGQFVYHGEFGQNPMMTGNASDAIGVSQGSIPISPGQHVIAIFVENGIDPEGDMTDNPGAVLFTCYASAPGVPRSPVLRHSDGTWQCLAYPPESPGMTPGEAMEHCLREAQSRGVLTDLRWTFDGAVDSAGQPWPIVGDISTKVGYDCLTFFRELSNTYVDLAISPAALVLYAWVSGGRGEDRDVELHAPTDPDDPSSGNLSQLTHKRVLGYASQLLVRWAGGWDNVPSFPSGGGREATLGLGATQSRDEMLRVGQAQLGQIADVRTEIAAELQPTSLDDTPVVSFQPGDFVYVPDWDGPDWVRVISIGGSLDDDGRLSWAIELRDRILDARERSEQALKKMDNGTLRGSSKVASPVGEVGKRSIPPTKFGGGGCG